MLNYSQTIHATIIAGCQTQKNLFVSIRVTEVSPEKEGIICWQVIDV